MSTIKKKHVIQKRNILNEIRANSMTLQELRFFSIYLSKINANDISTRVVRFPLSDFQAIMELSSKIKIDYMKSVTSSLLCKIVNVPNEGGGYDAFQLFKKCKVDTDENGEWFIEIDAHDDALPLMFEFKARYFTYQLWNALRLGSSNQLRMYEILKQYEHVGSRVLSVEELKGLLGIGKNEYGDRFGNFKTRVLDACQQALAEHTDIRFTYEPHGKRGAGGKILAIKFTISKNEDYIDQLTLDEFISMKKNDETEPPPVRTRHDEIIDLLSDACNDEFTKEQIQILLDLVIQIVPIGVTGVGTEHHDYLFRKYNELNYQDTKNKIRHRFEYFRTMIKAEVDKV